MIVKLWKSHARQETVQPERPRSAAVAVSSSPTPAPVDAVEASSRVRSDRLEISAAVSLQIGDQRPQMTAAWSMVGPRTKDAFVELVVQYPAWAIGEIVGRHSGLADGAELTAATKAAREAAAAVGRVEVDAMSDYLVQDAAGVESFLATALHPMTEAGIDAFVKVLAGTNSYRRPDATFGS